MHPGALARRRAEALDRMASAALEIADKLNDPIVTDLAAKIKASQGPNEEVRHLFRTEAIADLIVLINERLPEPPGEFENIADNEAPKGRRKRGQ